MSAKIRSSTKQLQMLKSLLWIFTEFNMADYYYIIIIIIIIIIVSHL